MDAEGCKFVKYRWGPGGEGATARKVPFTNSIYITFRVARGDQQSMNEKRITS